MFYNAHTPTGSLQVNPSGPASSKMTMFEAFSSEIASEQRVDCDLKYFFKDKQDVS